MHPAQSPAQPRTQSPDIAILSPIGRSGGRTHGGITPYVTALSAALCDAGTRVELVGFSPLDPRQSVAGIDPRLTVFNLGLAGRRRHRRALADYLARRQPRALLAAGHRANLLAAAQAGGATRIVLSVHNALTPGLRGLDPLRRLLRRRALRLRYPLADAIVCVSHGVAADLQRLVPASAARIAVIHNPIGSADAEPATSLHAWLASGSASGLAYEQQPPVVLAAGRLSRQKDFATLLRAFARMPGSHGYRLIIIGEGEERDNLARLAQRLGIDGRVALPGFVPNPRAHMAAARLFVLSSAWEGFGNVLVEAMGTGTPVVATDCDSGPREILQDGALGPLVPVGDHEALARAMAETLAAPVAAARLRERAADFAPRTVAARYLSILLPERQP
ncbi:glycosyltransferase [Thiohalocapsa marina]|uniref:Glycosyltransferase n=1 Tax=Thiohalocapsa marina TaxID=424902 RepID=A0A5M8FJF7_9GAMM|nr:glycosyltransferase [Thiohalocapsa marina]KAA6184644.1 glycosyltransferase [Thiohalocapsa marina]